MKLARNLSGLARRDLRHKPTEDEGLRGGELSAGNRIASVCVGVIGARIVVFQQRADFLQSRPVAAACLPQKGVALAAGRSSACWKSCLTR